MKGHSVKEDDLKFKEGDRSRFMLPCYTTDKILAFGTNGRFYTLSGNDLPAGRGYGEPVRLMVDLPNDSDILAMTTYEEKDRYVVAAETGHGFVVKAPDVLAQTRNGKQVLNMADGVEAKCWTTINEGDDSIAVIGENRKLLVFPLEELPEMGRGKGVILQKYKDGGVSDVKTFKAETGLGYKYGTGERIVEDLTAWLGKRAQAGRMPPNGFPKNNKFD